MMIGKKLKISVTLALISLGLSLPVHAEYVADQYAEDNLRSAPLTTDLVYSTGMNKKTGKYTIGIDQDNASQLKTVTIGINATSGFLPNSKMVLVQNSIAEKIGDNVNPAYYTYTGKFKANGKTWTAKAVYNPDTAKWTTSLLDEDGKPDSQMKIQTGPYENTDIKLEVGAVNKKSNGYFVTNKITTTKQVSGKETTQEATVQTGDVVKTSVSSNGKMLTISVNGESTTFTDHDTHNTITAGENISIEEDSNSDGTINYIISAKSSSNVKVIAGKNTTVSEGTEGEFTTYAVDVMTDGKVASGDQGIVTGDTVYNETRVKKDGNYIKKDNTAAENITALDEKVKDNSTRIDNINNQFGDLDNRMRKGLAGAAALAALHPMDFNPDDKMQFSAGVGHYRGETAAALGMFYRPDESVMFSLGGTFGNSDNMVNAGITFGLDGTRNRITRSRTAMAREIQDLRSLVTQMAARMDRLEGANTETAMFPDVPENHWAYEYVEDLQKRGALKGYPDGLFKGDRAMTRYEFAAMLDRLVRSGVMLDSKIAKEFEPELGRIYVERISGHDNDRKKVERVRVNNSDSKYPEGKTRDVYGSKIVTEVLKKPEAK
jgi:hypothetical protein